MLRAASISIRPLAVFLFVCAVLLHTISVPAQDGPDVQELRKKAIALSEEQKFTEALPMLEKLAVELPKDAEVHFYLGFALLGQAMVSKDEAEKRKLRVLGRNAFIKSKELGEQRPVLDAMIQSLPPDGSAGATFSQNAEVDRLMREGEALFVQGKHDDALRSYEKAHQLDPKNYEAALFSGDMHTQRGRFDKAEEWYQKAIAIDPNRETAYRYSATPLMRQNKYDQARDRYIEAYITEPYSRFSNSGILQWAQATNSPLGHPEIEIPDKVEFDANGNAQVDLGPDKLLSGKEDGSFAWTAYAPVRTAWRKEKFRKAFPAESEYRHSLSEEAEAIRAVLAAVKAEKAVKKLNPSLETLAKLDSDGLLEAYILLARPDDGIAQDHRAYLKQHRDKLRRYVVQYVIAPKKESPAREKPGEPKKNDEADRIGRTYDKADDKTTVEIKMDPITCAAGGCMFYAMNTSYPGTKPPEKMGSVFFGIIVLTKTLKPEADPPLLMRIDGKVHNMGQMSFAGEESMEGLRGLIYAIHLDESQLAAVANAKTVELKVGSLQFPLVSANIGLIAEFYRQARLAK